MNGDSEQSFLPILIEIIRHVFNVAVHDASNIVTIVHCFQCGSNTQLLHVFQEDFILGYKPHKEDGEGKETEIFFQPSQGIT